MLGNFTCAKTIECSIRQMKANLEKKKSFSSLSISWLGLWDVQKGLSYGWERANVFRQEIWLNALSDVTKPWVWRVCEREVRRKEL